MKKNTLAIISLCIMSSATFAQSNMQSSTGISVDTKVNLNQVLTTPVSLKPNQINTARALGQVFFTEYFDSTVVGIGNNTGVASDWTVAAIGGGTTGATYGWNVNSTEQSWYFNSVIASGGSGNKFAEVNNGTTTTPNQAVEYTLSMTNGIDIQALAGTHQVTLSFMQTGALFNDAQEIRLSTNGGSTYVTVYSNADKDVLSQTNPNAAYPNPETIRVNLAPFLDGQPLTNVKLQLHWTSAFPTSPSNNAWITYGWMLDNISLETNPDNEVSLNKVYMGDVVNDFEYTMIPQAQATPMLIGAILSNDGSNTETFDISVSIKLEGNEVHTTTEPVTIDAGVTDTVWIQTTYTPSSVGLYQVDLTIPDDDLISNNTGSGQIRTTPYVFAHDNDGSLNFGLTTEAAEESAVGMLYLPTANQTIYGALIDFASTSQIDVELDIYIYEVSGSIQGDLVNVLYQSGYITNTADINSGVVNIAFDTPTLLEAGKVYMLEVRKYDGAAVVRYTASAGDDDFATVGYGPFGAGGAVNYYNGWGSSPAIRMNFDPNVSIVENELLNNVSVFPNPSTNEAKVEFNLANASDVTINVTDITGKTVETVKLGNVTVGVTSANLNVANYATGIYNVVITTNETSVTSKLIKK